MASIKKRSNKWSAVFYVNGKQIIKTTGIEVEPTTLPPGTNKTTARKENEAKARLIASELEKQAKGGKVDENIIINAVGKQKAKKMLGAAILPGCEEFLKTWQSKRTIANPKNDQKAIKQFLTWLGERKDTNIDLITKQDAVNFMNHELERVKAGTVGLYLQALRTAFQTAVDARLFPYNPFSKVSPPKKDTQIKKAFTLDQVKKLVKLLPNEWADMVRVCLYTGGQRLGDIATLKWEQINLDKGHLRMTTEKTKRALNIPMIDRLKEILTRRLNDKVNAYVFPYAQMRHAQANDTSSKLSIEFGNLLKTHGFTQGAQKGKGDRRELADLSFHSLRATAVTVLKLAGVPLELCLAIVGHDSPDVQRVYFRPSEEDHKQAMQNLDLHI